MKEPLRPSDYDVAIIGGGAAGVLTAIQLLRRAAGTLRIVLLEAAPTLGEGVAYATRRPEHLLNVSAGAMSAFVDQPDDFVAYLSGLPDYRGLPAAAIAPRYVSRCHYAEYLRARLAQVRQASAARLEHLRARVLDMETQPQRLELHLSDQRRIGTRTVVLATGNALRSLPLRGAAGLAPEHCLPARDVEALAMIAADATVCIVGSGLSMVDCVATLHANGHRGMIHVLSRHGLMPLPHTAAGRATLPVVALPELLALPLRQRLRALRRQARSDAARGLPWQGLMEALRPHGQALWRSLCQREQRRFLRHLARYWDVHRHRIASQLHAPLQALREARRLHQHRARLDTALPHGACLRIQATTAHGGALCLDVHRIINATGLELRVQAMRNPLLDNLLGRGLAIAGPHGIGLDSNDVGHLLDADGQADPRIHVLGSLRIGRLWESLAIPELREQASGTASGLLHHLTAQTHARIA